MGLDEIVEENRSITSRKDPSNTSIPENAWREMAVAYPDAVYIAGSRADKNDARCLVALLEDVIENGVRGWNISEDQIETIKTARDDIIESKNL